MESRPIPHTKFVNTLMDVDFVVNSSISEGFAAIVNIDGLYSRIVVRSVVGEKDYLCEKQFGK